MQGAVKSEFGNCPRCCDTIAHLEYVATVLVRGRAAKYRAAEPREQRTMRWGKAKADSVSRTGRTKGEHS